MMTEPRYRVVWALPPWDTGTNLESRVATDYAWSILDTRTEQVFRLMYVVGHADRDAAGRRAVERVISRLLWGEVYWHDVAWVKGLSYREVPDA